MAFRLFQDENILAGLPPSGQSPVLAGVNDQDNGYEPAYDKSLPWTVAPENSWLRYQCWVETSLDAGMALHKPLPQYATVPDTLAQGDVYNNTTFAKNTNGVNTTSKDRFSDRIQKMATSTYIFRLRGIATRAGYQIPIPGLVSVCGQKAVPADRQWSSGNVLIANANGVPIYSQSWDLWYYVALPPKSQIVPAPNLAEHINLTKTLPGGMQMPFSMPDYNSVPQQVPQGNAPQQGGQGQGPQGGVVPR